jgi:hypothetical protein
LKDQALGVFVSEVSSPFDWVRRFIADGLVQASGSVPESAQTRIRSPVDDENALRSALHALGIVSEAGSVDQRGLVNVVPDAALEEVAASEGIRHCPDHERSTNSTGMW